MKEQLHDLLARLTALSARERGVILFATLGLIFAVWDAAIVRALDSDAAERGAIREALETRSRELGERSTTLKRLLASDPHADERTRQLALRSEIERIDELLRSQSGGLVPPTEMAALLRALLASRPAIHVVELESLGAEPLVDGDDETRAAASDADVPVYKHGMRIELEAGFYDIVAFLEEMEELEWLFFFDQLLYQVTEYPQARVTLVVHTLGSREGWIGV